MAEAAETGDLGDFSTAAGSPSNVTQSDAPKPTRKGKASMKRTFVTLPNHLLVKIRGIAVRRGLEENRKTSVSEIIVELLEQSLRKRNR